ncbi:hypothetical protein F5X98DRAFT_111452 [Xylaria grammica]|nr:hypothetical protein F5X98DRAFT_111452 [Xylaria grammica]
MPRTSSQLSRELGGNRGFCFLCPSWALLESESGVRPSTSELIPRGVTSLGQITWLKSMDRVAHLITPCRHTLSTQKHMPRVSRIGCGRIGTVSPRNGMDGLHDPLFSRTYGSHFFFFLIGLPCRSHPKQFLLVYLNTCVGYGVTHDHLASVWAKQRKALLQTNGEGWISSNVGQPRP